MKEKLLTTKNVVLMGMFGALAGVLMLFEFPLPFLAPSFYGLDVSEVPVLIGTFAMGPVAGLIYKISHTRKGAMTGLVAGTVLMAVVGVAANALVMLPFYSNFMPMETILAAGAAINPAVGSVWTFAFFCVGPFNLVKGVVVSVVTSLVYKRVSVLIHSVGNHKAVKNSNQINA